MFTVYHKIYYRPVIKITQRLRAFICANSSDSAALCSVRVSTYLPANLYPVFPVYIQFSYYHRNPRAV